MGVLTMMVPAPYRWLVLALLAAALVGYGWVKGADHVQAQWDAQKLATEVKIIKVQAAQSQATVRVVTKYVDRIQVVHDQAETIIKEVPKYVTSQADADCIIPTGVLRLLDPTVSLGPLPGASGGADGTATTTGGDQAGQ